MRAIKPFGIRGAVVTIPLLLLLALSAAAGTTPTPRVIHI